MILAEINFLVNNIADLENNETLAICATTIYSIIIFFVIFIKFIGELNDDIRNSEQFEEFIGITQNYRRWLRNATKIRHSLGVFAGIMMLVKAILKSFVTGKRHLPVNLEQVFIKRLKEVGTYQVFSLKTLIIL